MKVVIAEFLPVPKLGLGTQVGAKLGFAWGKLISRPDSAGVAQAQLGLKVRSQV